MVSGPDLRVRRVEWAAGGAATLAAVVLHLTFLQHAGALWRDEVNTAVTSAAPSLSRMWHLLEYDSFPLLWPLIERGWMAVAGSADGPLRLLGVLGGLSLVVAVWYAARRFGAPIPILSLPLLAINAEVIRWGPTVRAWGLGAALAVLIAALMKKVVQRPTRGWTAAAAFAAILSVQCVYQNAVFVGASVVGAGVLALARRDRRAAVRVLAIGAVAAVSMTPYVDVVHRRAQWQAVAQQPLTLIDLVINMKHWLGVSGRIGGIIWLALIGVGWASATIDAYRRLSGKAPPDERSDMKLYSAVVIPATVIGVVAFYLVLRQPVNPWYYFGMFAIVATLAEGSIGASVRSNGIRWAVSATSFLVLAAGWPDARAAATEARTNMDLVAQQLNAVADRNDLVVVNPWWFMVSLHRYYHGPADVVTIPPMEDQTVHRYDLVKAAMLAEDSTVPLLSRIRGTLVSGHHVWIVGHMDSAEREPSRLNRPPLPDSGWRMGPFMSKWTFLTSEFIRQHAVQAQDVPVGADVSPYERPRLRGVSGWREQVPMP